MLKDCFFQSRWTAFSTEGPHIRLELPFIFDLIADVRALSKSQNWSARPWLVRHFDKEIGFSQQFLLKNHLLRA